MRVLPCLPSLCLLHPQVLLLCFNQCASRRALIRLVPNKFILPLFYFSDDRSFEPESRQHESENNPLFRGSFRTNMMRYCCTNHHTSGTFELLAEICMKEIKHGEVVELIPQLVFQLQLLMCFLDASPPRKSFPMSQTAVFDPNLVLKNNFLRMKAAVAPHLFTSVLCFRKTENV